MLNLETINQNDKLLSEHIFSLHNAFLDWLFSVIALLGNNEVVVVITAVCVGWLLYARKNYFAGITLMVVTGSILSTYLLKMFFARPRPELEIVPLETYSFPSGHATAAIALYGTIAYILSKFPHNHHYRHPLIVLLLLVVVLVGFSRIYMGYHYLSDVLAGYLVGGAWLALSTYLFNNKEK